MIIAITKLRVIPDRCTKCSFSQVEYWDNCINLGRKCTLTHRVIPMDKSPKGNMQYVKPYWCPLREVTESI